MAQNNPNYYQYTSTVVLGSGQNADAGHVDVTGARAVTWTVTCDKTDQLTAALPQFNYTDGRQAQQTPGAPPAGTDSTTLNVNASGVITGKDLSAAQTAPQCVTLRSAAGSNSVERLWGIKTAWLTLTKAAVAGNATYTVVTTVYYG